ncbi:MAG TPA: hypothetical protein PLS53_02575 [Thermoanaerobaculaceae bacterium]|nr:hypothetical protein [Thermoanaerobaculaceae bacterium]HPS77017.1 hypothetical protein [Thermoanaerobaculaceae bacterium]
MSKHGTRGVSTVGTVLLAATLALLVATFLSRWMVVEVKPLDGHGPRLIVPVPLPLLQLAMRAIPDKELSRPMPVEVTRQRAQVLEAMRVLERAGDTTLLQVTSPDARVLIRKVGDRLELAVDGDEAKVRGGLPLDRVRQVLERWDWRVVHPGVAMDLVAAAGRGELLHVDAPDAQVSIRVW